MGSRRRILFSLVLLSALLAVFFGADLEPDFSAPPDAVPVSERALRLHQEAVVVDLHVDSLLWPRDLTRAGGGGHLDLPRMRRGGLDAVALSFPTRFFGAAGVKSFHDLWPPRTWISPWARLRYMLDRPRCWTEEDAILAPDAEAIRRNHRSGVLSFFHGVEGAHALEGQLDRVSELRRRGVRFIGLVHLSDNEIGGSASGSDRGLTELGRRLLEEMNAEGVLVDLAHASPRTFSEALERTAHPPIVSHAGARAVHDSFRNLSDDQIRAVAAQGGVIGVMLAPPALREPSLEEALAHLERVVEVGGEDAAAIGSDFDGYVDPAIDVSRLPQLTELMLRRGWSEGRIRKVLGENALRVLEAREPTAR